MTDLVIYPRGRGLQEDGHCVLEDLDGGQEDEDAEHEGADRVDDDQVGVEVNHQRSNKHTLEMGIV